MPTTATPWCGSTGDKLYLQSGQFTSTLKTSEAIGAIDTGPRGISWDGTNTPWAGLTNLRLYLQSGQFTSTLKTSQSVSTIDIGLQGVSWDGTNTPWCGLTGDKLYLQSGQFTSTLKTSEAIGAIDTNPRGISWDGTNTPWVGSTGRRLYLQSGQFTSTLKTSESINAIDTLPQGISWDGTNTPWVGISGLRLYLQSGQFTSTLKTSEAIGAIDTVPTDIGTDDVNSRLGIVFAAPTSGGRSGGPGFRVFKELTDEEQILQFRARSRTRSLRDIEKGLQRTHRFELTQSGIATGGIFPDRTRTITFTTTIEITGASAAGLIFEFGSSTTGIKLAIVGGQLLFAAGESAVGNGGIDGAVTLAALGEIGARLQLGIAISPGHGQARLWVGGELVARIQNDPIVALTNGAWSDSGNGSIGSVQDGTSNTRIAVTAAPSDFILTERLSAYIGQLPRQFHHGFPQTA